MKHEKLTGKQSTWAKVDDGDLEIAIQDTPAFKEHAERFCKAVCKTKRPSSVGDIRRRMGAAFRERWFDLTVIYLSDEIEAVDGYLSRWQKRTRPRLVLPDVSNRVLFAHDGSDSKVYPIL